MKKIDIILSLIAGEGVAWLFVWFLKNSELKAEFLYWILPIVFPILALAGIYICYLIGKKFLFVFQLAKFALIGAVFAIFDLIILNILMVYFGITKGIDYTIFATISFILATLAKYVVDKFWAFEQKEGKVKTEFSKFFIITIISAGIQIGIASIVVNLIGSQFGITALAWGSIGKIIGILFAMTWNFVGYKFIVFKK